MEYAVGKYRAADQTVAVTFMHQGVTHRRPVNACMTAGGKHDRAATLVRIEDVARGVAVKIEAGAIANPLPDPEPMPDNTPE